jgi:exopolysaccharide biosynthesis polyprenyl glycosylphosphotransferase
VNAHSTLADSVIGSSGASVRAGRNRGWIVRRALLTADTLGLTSAFVITALVFGQGAGAHNHLALAGEYLLFIATLPFWILGAKLHELYDRDEERTDHTTFDDFVGVLHVVTLGVWILFAAAHAARIADPELAKAMLFWALAIVLVTGARAGARILCRRHDAFVQNTLIVGADDTGQLVARKLLQHPEYGMKLIGFADNAAPTFREDIGGQRVVCTLADVPRVVAERNVHRVVIAFADGEREALTSIVARLKAMDVQIDIVPRLFDVVGPNVAMHDVEGLPLLGLPAPKLLPFSRTIKRAIDVVGASLLLLLTSPIFAFAAWRVRKDSPGPIFFRQQRVGQNAQLFTALKFRTMKVDTDQSAHHEFIKSTMDAKAAPAANGLYKLDQGDAVTRSGRWLRKTSLDELPQLVNVLRGDMSLVGPRPCLEFELQLFQSHHYERFRVPAGITGLWQVTARAHSTFGEALEFDVAYARNWSLGLDLLLMLRTPFQILRQRNGTA